VLNTSVTTINFLKVLMMLWVSLSLILRSVRPVKILFASLSRTQPCRPKLVQGSPIFSAQWWPGCKRSKGIQKCPGEKSLLAGWIPFTYLSSFNPYWWSGIFAGVCWYFVVWRANDESYCLCCESGFLG